MTNSARFIPIAKPSDLVFTVGAQGYRKTNGDECCDDEDFGPSEPKLSPAVILDVKNLRASERASIESCRTHSH